MCALDYSSIDIAVYLSQTNHSLAFKDGFKVHNIGGNNSENSNDMRTGVY